MEYSIYKQIAEQYIIEQKGTLDVLKTYNYGLEEKTYEFMLKQMVQYCSNNSNEIKNIMNTNKKYWKRFIEEHRG